MKFDLKWLQVADNENQHMVAGHKDQEMASSNRIMVSDNQDQEIGGRSSTAKSVDWFWSITPGVLIKLFFFIAEMLMVIDQPSPSDTKFMIINEISQIQ